MILADTSVWIEFLKGRNKEVGDRMLVQLKQRNVLAASPVFGELLQGVRNEREKNIVETYWNNLPKENEQDIFIYAGQLSYEYKLFSKGIGLIDCAILGLAIIGKHSLWTLDKKLQKIAVVVNTETR